MVAPLFVRVRHPSIGRPLANRQANPIAIGLVVACCALATTAHADATADAGDAKDEGRRPTTADAPRADIDATRRALRDNLALLDQGELPEAASLAGLFDVALEDAAAVAQRIEVLEALRDALARRDAELKSDLEALPSDSRADAPPPSPEAAPPDAAIPAEPPAPRATTPPGEAADAASAEASSAAPEATPIRAEEAAAAEAARVRRDRERDASRAAIQREREAVQIDLEIAKLRLASLRPLSRRLQGMTDAARRILPTLDAKRTSLREHAALLDELGRETVRLAGRVEALSKRGEAGLLVGFISERRSLTRDAASLAATLADQGEQLAATARNLARLADQIESNGRELQSRMLRSMAQASAGPDLDPLFLSHVRTQRRLRKSVSQVLEPPGRSTLVSLQADTAKQLSNPDQIGTSADARAALGQIQELQSRLGNVLMAETVSRDGWRLAFENEVVTVLSEQASPAARSKAYGLSREIVDDIASELQIASDRLRTQIEMLRNQIPTARALVATEQGQSYLMRGGAMLALLGASLLVRRRASRITVLCVRSLARLPLVRTRVGLLVRSSGLLQAVLPPAFALAALLLAIAVAGPTSTAAEHLRAVLLPLILYVLGLQILSGATRRITRGRPALIEVDPSTFERLRKTYVALGLVVAIGTVLDGVARIAVGAGRLVALLDLAILAWVALWVAWEAVQWRGFLANAWRERIGEPDEGGQPGFEERLAGWMGTSPMGFVLSPIALGRIVATALAGLAHRLATRTDLIQRVRAQVLRRRSKATLGVGDKTDPALPPAYLDAFPLHPILGEDDALLVPRDEPLKEVYAQIDRWRESRAEGSLALIGEKGAGKTTLAALIAKRVKDLELVHHTITGKPGTPDALLRSLAPSLGAEGLDTLDDLRAFLCEGPDRIVLLDEAHNVFLRRVDGYQAYDALVELVNATASKIFWVPIFNNFTWRFLNESRGRVHYFRKLLYVPNWSPEELQSLIALRNKRTGFELEFDAMLLSDNRFGSHDFELVEGSDGYFRLLWESSGGNPRIATQLWLSSLSQVGESRLRVGLFREPDPEAIASLQDDLMFALAAFCQHENLSANELAVVLNVSEGFANFAVRFLTEAGMLEAKDAEGTRQTLSPRYYRAVLRALRSRHLLLE